MKFEPGGQRGGCRRGHGLRHGERAYALGALVLADDIGRFDDLPGRRAARAHDDADALVLLIVCFFEAGISNRLLHGHVVPGTTLGQEAHGATIDQFGRIERGLTPDLAAETILGEIGRKGDARFGIAQGCGDFGGIGTDGGHDAQTRYYNPSHLSDLLHELKVRTGPVQAALSFDRPTRRSVA